VQVTIPGDPPIPVALHDLGLACCALEVEAALRTGMLGPSDPSQESVRAHVLIVGGTITQALAPAVVHAWERLPEPRAVLAFGACATSGGPYWDAPTVVNGLTQAGISVLDGDMPAPPTVFVPGCPPRPQALVAGLAELVGSLLQ